VSTVPEMAREQEKLVATMHLAEGGLFHGVPARRRTGLGSIFAALDGLVVIASGLLAYMLRQVLGNAIGFHPINPALHLKLFGFLLIYAGLTVVCNASQDLYSEAVMHSAQGARMRIVRAFIFSSLLAIMVIFVAGETSVPRRTFAVTALISLIAAITLRYLLQLQNMKRIERGMGTRHVLIVGAGDIARAFHRYLSEHRYLGKEVCGLIDDEQHNAPLWLGGSQELPRILKEHFIDEIYFTPGTDRDLIMNVALQARQDRIAVSVVPDLYGGLALGAELSRIGNVPVLQLNHQPIPAAGLFFKRLMDIVIAGTVSLLSSPLMLLAALAIKLDSAGPVIYSSWRVGRKGRKFRCYKFRTMIADADARKDELRHLNERNGATFKISNDPRITHVGRLLRKFSIDEFPQLFNVLKGDMSMVGPRPHPEDDYDQYQLEDLRRLAVLPGITGLWQVSARSDPSFETNVMLDLEYINNWSLLMDVKILFKTVPEVFKGSGR